jgi:diguanylate cyclase (GGDEF)-like protein
VISVLTCIRTQHDPWLLALALAICCVGALAATRLTMRASACHGIQKLAWSVLAALTIGTATWTTHFISILAYIAAARVHYDAALTILSLLVAVGGSLFAVSLATWRRHSALSALGGGVLGLAIASMHYVGMLAYKIEGVVHWHSGYLILSIVLAVLLGALSMTALFGPIDGRGRPRMAAALLVLTILALHFTGITAMEVIPSLARVGAGGDDSVALALATAVAAGLIFGAGTLAYISDLRMRGEADARLAALEFIDQLTGLPNRVAFTERLAERVVAAKPGDTFAIILFDLQGLDGIGQQFGTRYPGMVISAIASRLVEARRPGVFLARIGPTQFCGVGAVVNRDDAHARAKQLHAALSRELLLEGVDVPLDLRIGVSVFPEDASEDGELLRKAQAAVASAAADPMCSIAMHDEALDASIQRRLRLANDLRHALERNEFELFFQPQVQIVGHQIVGYEALIRWQHPELGAISPAEFIPLAERTGKIIAIGSWTISESCAQAARWPSDSRVAVNVSPLQLRQTDLPQQIHEALLQSGLPPHRLEIELTESLLIDDKTRALHVLRRIKALGVHIALDDFGTGYSSMEVLRLIPFDKVKLDKSFVDDIETSRQARAILHAMIALGRELDIAILAEGVERQQQMAILRLEGCDLVQGYLTGRAVPADAVPALLPHRFAG